MGDSEAVQNLEVEGTQNARVAAIEETAGLLADAPDWPEWLRMVRGTDAEGRLLDLGLVTMRATDGRST